MGVSLQCGRSKVYHCYFIVGMAWGNTIRTLPVDSEQTEQTPSLSREL